MRRVNLLETVAKNEQIFTTKLTDGCGADFWVSPRVQVAGSGRWGVDGWREQRRGCLGVKP